MSKANSNNHGNQGQNVLYADGHVQWQTSPFCGVACVTVVTGFAACRGTGFNDNIYTSRGGWRLTKAAAAEQGQLLNTPVWFPADGFDSYLLPTDDGSSQNAPGGRWASEQGLIKSQAIFQ